MELRNIEFGNLLGASGVQGFFGEGYWYHRALGPFGPVFDGMTFVAKTTTLNARAGNMPLTRAYEPREWFPSCIWTRPWSYRALNAVNLSGPGAEKLLMPEYLSPKVLRWQERREPFFFSFMSVEDTAEKRLAELRLFVKLLKRFLPYFSAPVGLQINVSCPNTGLDPDQLVKEVAAMLDTAAELNIPLMPKFNLLAPAEAVVEMSKHPAYDATCMANTIPFGKYFRKSWWDRNYPKGSPLAKFGGGGLSGDPLFWAVHYWMRDAIEHGMQKPMNIGGGIMQPNNIDLLVEAGLRPGVDSVFIGTVAMVRPWRVQGIIKRANDLLGGAPVVALRPAA